MILKNKESIFHQNKKSSRKSNIVTSQQVGRGFFFSHLLGKIKDYFCFTLAPFENKVWLVVGVFLLSTVCVSGALAADFKAEGKTGNITISEGESLSNLYTGGNVILINSNIGKDLLTGGRTITVNGDVEDDLWAAGQSVVINGRVGGSVRTGGGDVVITGVVEEDVFAGGNNITIEETAEIRGDLFVGGNTIIINGSVSGDIRFVGDKVTINNKVGGKVQGRIGKTLTLGSKAEIVGDLNYSAPKELTIEAGGKVLGETRLKLKEPKAGKQGKFLSASVIFGIFTLWFLIKIVSLIVAGLVLVYAFKKVTRTIIEQSFHGFWRNIGIGFIALVVTPIACIILLITVIGMWLSGIAFLAYLFIVTLVSLLAKIAFGSWLIKTLKKEKDYKVNWASVVVGVLVLKVISFIPLVGWIVWVLFMLAGLGVLYRAIFRKLSAK